MYCCSYHNLSHDVKYILYSKTVAKLQLFLKICKYIMQKNSFFCIFFGFLLQNLSTHGA